MRTSIPFLAAAACLFALATSPVVAQTNPELPGTPAASTQSNVPDGAAPKATPTENPTKKPGSKDKPPGVRIDATGVHVGGTGGVDITTGFSPLTNAGWFAEVISLAAILSPFVTLVLIFAIVLHFRHRRRVILHETLRTMIEKGLPIPPELLSGGADGNMGGRPLSAHRDLRGGLVLLGLGAVLFFVSGKWGAIPCVIGAALLAVWCFERWEKSKQTPNP